MDQGDPLISVLTIHEIAYGADRAPDPGRRSKLLAWVAAIKGQFAGRIIEIDAGIAELAGRLRLMAESQAAPLIRSMPSLRRVPWYEGHRSPRATCETSLHSA